MRDKTNKRVGLIGLKDGISWGLLIFGLILGLSVCANATPALSFQPPTPADGTITDDTSVVVNVSITEANLSEFKFNWNGTNYSFYDDSLVLGMNFNNNSADDFSKYKNNGIINGANYTSGGRYGGAFEFDGINDYVNLGSPVPLNLQIQNEITIESWIYVTQYPSSSTLGTIAGCQYDTNGAGYAIHLDGRTNSDGQTSPPGHIHFQIGNGGWHATNSNSQVPLNQWVYIVATRRANEDGKIYYNGVQQPSTSAYWAGSIAYSGAELDIGRQSGYTNRYFNGSIDEVRIYNRSLSADEVRMHYYSNLNKYDTDKWQFITNQYNLSAGTYTYQAFAKDITGNSNRTETRSLTIQAVPPQINFASPTPANGTVTTNTNVRVNVSITEANLSEFKFNWNGTNYSYYNDSLVLMMNFDNVSAIGDNNTNAVDVSKYGTNGAISSGATWTPDSKYGGAYSFNGVDGTYISGDASNLPSSSDRTLTMWIKPIGVANYRVFSYGGNGDCGSATWLLVLNSDGSIKSVGHCDESPFISSSGAITFGEWNHLVFVSNSVSGRKYYVNGNLISSNPSPIPDTTVAGRKYFIGTLAYLDGTSDCNSGNGCGAYQDFNGLIDELRVYDRSLSADEVKQLYESNLNKYDTDKWQFIINPQIPEPFNNATYTYFGAVKDIAGNSNRTETRSLTIQAVPPKINFAYPTPANGAVAINANIQVNVSITEANLSEFKFNWNGTNYSFYDDSLVMMYNFDNVSAIGESGTNIVNLAKKSINGTCTNMGASCAYASGVFGSSLSFDGTDDYVSMPAEVYSGNNYTWSIWVKPASLSSSYRTFFVIYSTLYIYYYNSELRIYGTDTSSGGERIVSNVLPGTGWTHLAFRYAPHNLSIYKNGNYFGSVDILVDSNPHSLIIGSTSTNYYHLGRLDEFRTYNRSLSDNEIKQLYVSNLQKYDTNKWQFYSNQSNLPVGTYTYQAFAKDSAGNENQTELRYYHNSCDFNLDGIVTHDYRDLMNAYKCFLGINTNCNAIRFQDWQTMKKEYDCFVDSQ